MSRPAHLEAVPESRRAPAREVAAALLGARRIVMTTHVNSDGDADGYPGEYADRQRRGRRPEYERAGCSEWRGRQR